MRNIKVIEKISILAILVFLVGTFVYIIKCPTRDIICDSPLTIVYPEGTIMFWEFDYMILYFLILSFTFCIIHFVQSKWVKVSLWLFFTFIALNFLRSTILMYKEIQQQSLKPYSTFWICVFLASIFFIVIAIKYINKK